MVPVADAKKAEMKTIIKRGILLLMGVVFALLVGEVVARRVYTKPWHMKLLEEQARTNWKSTIKRNSLGLRDRDYPDTTPSNSTRVLILGDSFTFGSGVIDDSVIFPELLEKRLCAELAPKGETVEILNGGIRGSLTHEWVDLLKRMETAFRPDVVLVVFFLRDGTLTGSNQGFFSPVRKEIEARNAVSGLYRHSYLVRMCRDKQDRRYLSAKYSSALNESYFGSGSQTQEWENAKGNILQIKAISEKMGAKIGLVVFPVLVELNSDYPFRRICDEVVQFSLTNNIPTHNLLPSFMGMNGPDLWVSAYDQHPNAAGHEVAARSIQPFLRQLIDEQHD